MSSDSTQTSRAVVEQAVWFFIQISSTALTALQILGFPTAFSTNQLTVNEIGPEGSNGFTYTPLAGQPGFIAGAAGPVTFGIQSDVSSVPEPSSIILLGTGVAAVLLVFRRRIGRRLKEV